MPRYSDACRISITSRNAVCIDTAIQGLRSSTSERAGLEPPGTLFVPAFTSPYNKNLSY